MKERESGRESVSKRERETERERESESEMERKKEKIPPPFPRLLYHFLNLVTQVNKK